MKIPFTKKRETPISDHEMYESNMEIIYKSWRASDNMFIVIQQINENYPIALERVFHDAYMFQSILRNSDCPNSCPIDFEKDARITREVEERYNKFKADKK